MVESIQNMDALMAITGDLFEGRQVWLEEEQKTMIYTNNEWQEVPQQAKGNVEVSLYEINRQIVSQLPKFEDINWSGAEKVLNDWIVAHENNFYLLYGREINYFTLLQKVEDCKENLFEVIKDCLDHIGEVHAFDVVEDKSAVEIWVKFEDTMTCMYLFPYDEGVVPFA